MTSSEATKNSEGPTESVDDSTPPFHLVALGASAGGLDSLRRFFDHLSAEAGAAYVVLMHLTPDRASDLVQILNDHASLPVREIEDGIFLSAYTDAGMLPGDFADQPFLEKPFSGGDPAAALEELVSNGRPQGPQHPVRVVR